MQRAAYEYLQRLLPYPATGYCPVEPSPGLQRPRAIQSRPPPGVCRLVLASFHGWIRLLRIHAAIVRIYLARSF